MNSVGLLRGESWKLIIQQTLPELRGTRRKASAKRLWFSYWLLLLSDTLECTVKLSVASAAATNINPVLNLTIAVSLNKYSALLLLWFLSFFYSFSLLFLWERMFSTSLRRHRANVSTAFTVVKSPRAERVDAGNCNHRLRCQCWASVWTTTSPCQQKNTSL